MNSLSLFHFIFKKVHPATNKPKTMLRKAPEVPGSKYAYAFSTDAKKTNKNLQKK